MSENFNFKQSKTKELIRTIVRAGFDLLLGVLKTPVVKKMLLYSYEGVEDDDHREIVMFIKEIVKCVIKKYKEESSKIDFKDIINTMNDNYTKDNVPPLESIQGIETVLPAVFELYGKMISSELSKCSEIVAAEHLPYERFERVAKAICSRVDSNCIHAGSKDDYNTIFGIFDNFGSIEDDVNRVDKDRAELIKSIDTEKNTDYIFEPEGDEELRRIEEKFKDVPTDKLIENIDEEFIEIIDHIRANDELYVIPHLNKMKHIFWFRALTPDQDERIKGSMRDLATAISHKNKGEEQSAERDRKSVV